MQAVVVVVLVLGEEPQYIMQLAAEWQFVLEILGWEWDILFRFFVVFFGAHFSFLLLIIILDKSLWETKIGPSL